MLRLDLCNYSDAYIIVKGTFTFQTENNAAIDGYNRNLILKNHVPFIKFISNINNVLINNAEDLDNVCLCSFSLSIENIIQRHLVLYGITQDIF